MYLFGGHVGGLSGSGLSKWLLRHQPLQYLCGAVTLQVSRQAPLELNRGLLQYCKSYSLTPPPPGTACATCCGDCEQQPSCLVQLVWSPPPHHPTSTKIEAAITSGTRVLQSISGHYGKTYHRVEVWALQSPSASPNSDPVAGAASEPLPKGWPAGRQGSLLAAKYTSFL